MKQYRHSDIEKKWQEKWEAEALYQTPDKKDGNKNFYTLVEFPYPSGNLHVGHWYAFAVPDVFVRTKRMQGENVLYPIGFDAFGLPAENAAIKHGVDPRSWTYENIDRMRTQLRSMGAAFDWSREIATCDPSYYKWTQWFITQLFERGMLYQKETAVNWCPSCKTVLANEQVVNGECERCDSEVERREMNQWNIKITDYADRLIDDLDDLDWPESIKESQRNWIGRSEGATIEFGIKNHESRIKVFTTRPDTLFGATYMVLAPEHELVKQLLDEQNQESGIKNQEEVKSYIAEVQKKTEIERTAEDKDTSTGSVQAKTGVELKGVKAVNPATKEEIPVYIADYVMAHYGTGAIMAVPAHDERDFAFAQKYDLPIRYVIEPQTGSPQEQPEQKEKIVAFVQSGDKVLTINWGSALGGRLLVGGTVEDGEDPLETAKREIAEETGYTDIEFVEKGDEHVHHEYFAHSKGKAFRARTTIFHFNLKSDVQDAQALEDDEHGKFSVEWVEKAEADKDITDPLHQYVFNKFAHNTCYTGPGILTNSGEFSGLSSEDAKQQITEFVGGEMTTTYKLRDWTVSRQRYWGVPIPIIHCDDCGPVAVPEQELPVELPEISDYLPRDDGESPLAKAHEWMHVSCPKCGSEAKRETDTLDTFVDSSWYYLRYLDPGNEDAFASREKIEVWMPIDMYSGGSEHTTMHVLYSRFFHKALFDMGLVGESEPYTRRMNRGLILGPDGNKMSKSKGNIIDPDEVVAQLGTDTVRLYLAFIGPFNEAGSYPWNPDGVVGVRKFLERVWRLQEAIQSETSSDVEKELHKTIKKVTEDNEAMKFNTAIAQMMTFVNEAAKQGVTHDQYQTLLKLLAPFAPHIAEELWREVCGNEHSIHTAEWPTYDESQLVEEEVTIAIQVNGKVRGEITMPREASEEDVKAHAQEHPRVAKWIEGKEVKKVIYVPGKLVNIAVASEGC